jgi:hypothetical protein
MPKVPNSAEATGAVDGDAGSYLEELIPAGLDGASTAVEGAEVPVAVELVGPHLRLAGDIALGRFKRLSDRLNHHDGALLVGNSTVLRRNGTPTRVRTHSIWMNLAEVTLVGESTTFGASSADLRVPKEAHSLVIVTPGHTLTGDVYIPVGAEIGQFIESTDPPFIPMTDVRTRSLADRRIVTRYEFALVNRRHIVAATEAPPGMLSDRRVL